LTRNFTFLAMICLAGCFSAFGQGLDPQLYVESLNSSCTDITNPCGADPNLINPNSIYVGFAGNHTAVSPLLIIVGVPQGGSAPTLSIETPGVTAALAGSYYGLNHATTGTLAGAFESTYTAASTCADAYDCSGSGLASDNSESFVNWTEAKFKNGATNPDAGVTSFNLYAYAIAYALGTNANPSPINIDFSGAQVGDYVIAYNCGTSGPSCSGGDVGDTPFTDAGFVTPVTPTSTPTSSPTNTAFTSPTTPEPSSTFLLGSAVIGVFMLLRKRFSRA